MSYDISLTIDTGGCEPAYLTEWNYTSNCGPMWRKAMPNTEGLAGLHQLSAENGAQEIRSGIEAMEADPAPYRALNPENGWGDFESQLEALKRLLAQCERHPRAVIEVSR